MTVLALLGLPSAGAAAPVTGRMTGRVRLAGGARTVVGRSTVTLRAGVVREVRVSLLAARAAPEGLAADVDTERARGGGDRAGQRIHGSAVFFKALFT